ncbi:DNA-binding transcriptional MerR regulator [Bradyrhizobium japonicum]|uniref:DNA-binding transcriptional MerR regulator n=1 Tax=Bradyrhizobium elkanii TaxID=29448 RepID=A0A8I1YHC7_BRAEL|nr:MerR family transcriptional regulator [Bradyrhizobium elkanii]MBP1299702.1 DNA-binding transcriptional MerR regulator [Bradyrhizobium elkanii]MBP2428764.1 DNA-binding transcriptional MerR regulator [Bradyrhizobium elkanii]MCP1729013.1 DNA-binding transcriptional MerR regulator [Bradyrhizobium elkanii]MCP1971997.1 DNA-binding transcriptional MerR regulator [Bradyrhizobium elkanii]MCS3519162.1 DNA-binding transcriptional MerR regulator [Bradyrhizobium elkanii]
MTVRTLHHYEHTGLLAASERTDGGHRMYDRESVQRVHQIRALRELGFSLHEIRKAMEGTTSLIDLLRKHLERIELQVARATLLRDRLRDMTTGSEIQVSVDELPATLDAMSKVQTRSQTSRCTCKLAIEREERWRRIRDELRDCMDRGEHPCGERAKAVAVAARLLISEIAGADSRVSTILKVLARLSAPRSLAGWDPTLMQYLDLALAGLEDQPY